MGLRKFGLLIFFVSPLLHSQSLWTPNDLELASKTALTAFKDYYYDKASWKQIQSYYAVKTVAGAVVRISFVDAGSPVVTDFICHYIQLDDSTQMECREH